VTELEPGAISLDRSRRDLAPIVTESVSSALPLAAERGVALTLDAAEVLEVEIDPVRLGQVIDNLLSNALKFTPPGGTAEVRVFGADGQAVVELADTGVGMSASEQEHVFERFYRAESAVKQSIQGTGLGLWISRSIVEAHGGTITLATSSPGIGTTFRIELPLPRARVPAPAMASNGSREGAR
jgi:signal transduction histidine kinase